MAKFKEKNVSGVLYDRLSIGVINLAVNGDAKFTFQQSRYLSAGQESAELPANTFTINAQLNGDIALRDPATNNLTGVTITQRQLVEAFYGLYVQEAP